MLRQHELLSLVGRKDINELAHMKHNQGKFMPGFLSNLTKGAEMTYGSLDQQERLCGLKRGSSYVPTLNAILLQKHSSHDSKIQIVAQFREKVGEELKDGQCFVNRSWCPVINNIQIEDPECYGYPLKATIF
jgi:hypothetical protein